MLAPAMGSAEREAREQESLEWTVFLLGRHPRRGVLALAVCLLTGWFVWSLSGSAWLTGLGCFVLLASLSSFWLPTRYRLDAETIQVSNFLYRRTRRWAEFRGLRSDNERLKLQTLPHDSRLDNYRGMLLLLPPDPAPVLEFARRRLEERRGDPA